MAGDQGTGCVRSRGGGATGGRVRVPWHIHGSASVAVVAQSGLGTDSGWCRLWRAQVRQLVTGVAQGGGSSAGSVLRRC